MNEPREPVTPGEWQEVQRAYREAPPPGPSAGLDARVRAAVEAELAASGAEPTQSAQVIEFPRWRRVAVPLATAATIVVAIGVAWFERTNTSGTPVIVTSASIPEAKDAPADPARIADAGNATERPATLKLDMPTPVAAPSTPPVMARSAAPDPAAALPPALAPPPPPALAPAPAAEPAAASDRLLAAKPAPAQRSEQRVAGAEATANGALAEVAAPVPPATLEQVRQLLRDGQREAARAVFKRWREAHTTEAVPDDLKALATEAAR
jgi:hypothetical protein